MIRRFFGINGKPPIPDYTMVKYTTVGDFTFDIPQGITKVKLTIAGAGGGGGYNIATYAGGNGGRGGYQLVTKNIVGVSNLSITVGRGGVRGTTGGAGGNSGGNSVVKCSNFTLTSTGGGGGTYNGTAGANGTPSGAGGVGGAGGSRVSASTNGANGWVYIEYGVGIE